jgi:hypothetical protein
LAAKRIALEKFADSAATPRRLALVRSADWKLAPLLLPPGANVSPSRMVSRSVTLSARSAVTVADSGDSVVVERTRLR